MTRIVSAIVVGVYLVITGLCGGLYAAEPPVSPLATQPFNPALTRWGNAIVFYLSCDQHPYAEITAGLAEPQSSDWRTFLERRRNPFQAGVCGLGLESGDYTLSYLNSRPGCLGNLGSLAIWLKANQLLHRGDYYWPVRLHVAGTYNLMLGRMGDLRNKEILYAYLEHGKTHATVTAGTMAEWKPDDWHLLVVNWDRNGVELSVDGESSTRAALREPLPVVEAADFRVTVNSPTGDTILMDELLILNTPLTREEIERLRVSATPISKP